MPSAFPKEAGGQGAVKPLAVGALTTLLATAVSYGLPEAHAASGVGFVFLAAAYTLVLRRELEVIRHHGLGFGGLFEPAAVDLRRFARDGARAVGNAALLALVVFPPFWLGWLSFWHPTSSFDPAPASFLLERAPTELIVIALPEEAFYRGYLQTALDDAWPRRVRVLGAPVGPALVVTSAIFAVGHLFTDWNVARLAVFFPSLLFGFLRARTGGVGAAIVFHALCNLFTMYLARSYGLT